METYIVLAGGFRDMSVKPDICGYEVDSRNKSATREVDYVVKVKGLPDNLFKPVQVKRVYKHFCKTCNRIVPSEEVKARMGCFVEQDCEVVSQWKDVEVWENGVCDKYYIPTQPWISPCYRIFLNNGRGIEKWKTIWNYIKGVYPPTKMLVPDNAPRAVGNRIQWTLTINDVPCIDLTGQEEKKEVDDGWSKPEELVVAPEKAPEELFECDKCGKEFAKNKINAHRWGKHKLKKGEK